VLQAFIVDRSARIWFFGAGFFGTEFAVCGGALIIDKTALQA
jgi:hypothetical protein